MTKAEIKEELLLNYMLNGMNLEQNGLSDTIEDLVSMSEKATEEEVMEAHKELQDKGQYHKFNIKVQQIAKDLAEPDLTEWLIMSSNGEDGSGIGDLHLLRIGEPQENEFPSWVALDWGIGEDEEKWIKAKDPNGEISILLGFEIFRFQGTWDERQCEELEYKDIPIE